MHFAFLLSMYRALLSEIHGSFKSISILSNMKTTIATWAFVWLALSSPQHVTAAPSWMDCNALVEWKYGSSERMREWGAPLRKWRALRALFSFWGSIGLVWRDWSLFWVCVSLFCENVRLCVRVLLTHKSDFDSINRFKAVFGKYRALLREYRALLTSSLVTCRIWGTVCGRIEGSFEGVEENFEGVEGSFEGVEGSFEGVEGSFDLIYCDEQDLRHSIRGLFHRLDTDISSYLDYEETVYINMLKNMCIFKKRDL